MTLGRVLAFQPGKLTSFFEPIAVHSTCTTPTFRAEDDIHSSNLCVHV